MHIVKSAKSWPMLDPQLDDIGVVRSSSHKFDFRCISRFLNVYADILVKDTQSREDNYSLIEVKDSIRLSFTASIYETS